MHISRAALFVLALASGCSHAARPARLPEAVLRDPLLGLLPLGTDLMLQVDIARLVASPAYASVRGDVDALGNAMRLSPCGPSPLTSIASFTIASDLDSQPMLVLRGSDHPPTRACGDAFARALLGEVPHHAADVGPLRIYAYADRFASLRATLGGDAPTLADDPRYQAIRPSLAESALVAVADVDALVARGVDPPPVLGFDRERSARMLRSATLQSLDVRIGSDAGLLLTAITTFEDSAGAHEASVLAADALPRELPFLHAALLSAPSALELSDVDGEQMLVLEHAIDALRIREDGTTMRVELALDRTSTDAALDLVRRAFERYVRLAQSAEARSNVVRLAEAMRALAESSFRENHGPVTLPSAPETPAEVPRGIAVEDPPGTWDQALFVALAFSMEGPHRYTYAVAGGSDGFRVTAHGDLDGDGIVSEFSIVGRCRADGTVELGELEVDDELE